ncbi:UDP-glucose/GDP-mannose dehydrogenase family protein [Candidatus Babeliales bacterium]|nr:UDP-glucose/GDP-mannose dehydrogenase family protein [Candidatus Babeliales bacterium]
MKITVIGAGYVGLVTAACFAQKDNDVTIVENNQAKITALLQGIVPFYEPGLEQLVANGIADKKINFVADVAQALKKNQPDVIFSCVGTPSREDGSADLSFVWQVAQEIGQQINGYTLVVNKSTVPVGTAENVKAIIQEQLRLRSANVPFDVASNPEFLKEGDALSDFTNPDRVVIGVDSEKAAQILAQLYKPFLKNPEEQLVCMDIPSAELTKYASNAMLATRISFMNQLALLADKVGADIEDVKKGMALDQRIGKHFLNAGIGYGGSCFPKDVKALIHTGKEHHLPMTLIQEVDAVNMQQRQLFFNKIIDFYGDTIVNKQVGIWGLAFKPETDDIRCAPAIDIIAQLIAHGAQVIAYDPVATSNMQQLFKNTVTFAQSAQEVVKAADFLIILTEWHEFKAYDITKLTQLKDQVIFDGRNCFDPELMQEQGFCYINVGRNVHHQNTKKLFLTKKQARTCQPPCQTA